jgi:hypothetical protein
MRSRRKERAMAASIVAVPCLLARREALPHDAKPAVVLVLVQRDMWVTDS